MDEAERLFREAIAIWKSTFGDGHPEVQHGMRELAEVLKLQNAALLLAAGAGEAFADAYLEFLDEFYPLVLAEDAAGATIGQRSGRCGSHNSRCRRRQWPL